MILSPSFLPSRRVAPLRSSAVALLVGAALLAGCTIDSGPRGLVDYRSSATPNKPLEVPPDLSQLARESRYQPQGGVVSASAAATAPSAVAAATPTVALQQRGDIRVERLGSQRWLVVGRSPDQLWTPVRNFWEQAGFTLALENPQAGLLETNWSENRAKLPADVVRNTIGGLLGRLYDTGERDQYRTRIDRSAEGSEIHISHRGIEEVYADERREGTVWRARPSDPSLEAEMLARLMVALGVPDEPARTAVASAPEVAAKARALTADGVAALEVDDAFDRAWRRVSLALDRGGFTVEDRDRAAGLFYVRYVDPRAAGREGPGFFARLFSSAPDPTVPVRYRIAVKAGDAAKTTVSVLTASGGKDVGENGQRIVSLLVNELK